MQVEHTAMTSDTLIAGSATKLKTGSGTPNTVQAAENIEHVPND